jgi:hypothetical protein
MSITKVAVEGTMSSPLSVFLFTIYKYYKTTHIHSNPTKDMSVLPATDCMESRTTNKNLSYTTAKP